MRFICLIAMFSLIEEGCGLQWSNAAECLKRHHSSVGRQTLKRGDFPNRGTSTHWFGGQSSWGTIQISVDFVDKLDRHLCLVWKFRSMKKSKFACIGPCKAILHWFQLFFYLQTQWVFYWDDRGLFLWRKYINLNVLFWNRFLFLFTSVGITPLRWAGFGPPSKRK